ncbi:MAG: hypothetical protein M5U19_09320 [Microthrixaceae bacterium]|nr:hypothetical protein [Microthrixaceae bacterium]
MSINDDRFDAPPATGDAVEVPQTITCVDCGGRCGLLTTPDRDHDGHPIPFRAGDVVAYRCSDCLDRWDIVLE